ncbi:MAG: hypothetical protein KDC79_14435 [Cyclobacteriaceae bacterium]|nr:hypothetical protein [Cyclobacteriaceae bacterium]
MKKLLYIASLFLLIGTAARSQTYPVSASTQLVPPYSIYLADYVASGTDRLALNVFLGDVNRPELQVKLRLRIEGQGIRLETKPEYLPPPLILQGGVPERLISTDLADYFQPQNLNFQGITRQQFERTGALPEGLYQFCFEVLEYNRGVQISNSACTMAWLILNDPPLINLPKNGEKIRPQDPQYITFQWTPRHTGSPNSAFNTEYEFSMVELWPETRNPNDAILTSPPVYEATTQSTTLIYGPAETPLVAGRKYAFRVRAKSIVGVDELDLFKNQGYSETYTFTYGDACNLPENIIAEALNAGKIKITWQANYNHSSFSVRYRLANTADAEWYEEDSFFDEIEITDLQPETTYEYQVSASCGTFTSDFSTKGQVTTAAMPEVEYTCGLPPLEYDIQNTTPVEELKVGDIIKAGDFDVKIAKLTPSGNTYTGNGTVVVPYLDNLAVSVDFVNIEVNTDYRLFRGYMNVTGIGVDVLSDEVMDFIDQLDEALASIDNVLGEVSSGLDLADEILSSVETLANEILDDGPFSAEEEATLEGLTVEEYNEKAKEALADAISAVAEAKTTDNYEEVAHKAAQAVALKNRAKRLQEIYDTADTLKVIAVEFVGATPYGFDKSAYAQHRLHYNIMVTPDGTSTPIPWAAVSTDGTTTVKGQLLPDKGVAAANVVFKSAEPGSQALDAQLNGDEWTITLPPITSNQVLTINAINSETNETVGKLQAIGYTPMEERTVYLVPVNGSTELPDATTLANYLNNEVFKQAVANKWQVQLADNLEVPGFDGTLQDDEQATLSTYSEGMKEIIRAFKDKGEIDDNAFYLFFVPNSSTGNAGYMPRKHRYGFIYVNNQGDGDIKRTVAHELGHGAFRLQHTWEDYPGIAQGTSQNLMDYSKGTVLRKYQWDLIHNPPLVVGLLEDESEGASEGGTIDPIIMAYVEGKAKELNLSNEEVLAIIHCKECSENDNTKQAEPITNLDAEFGETLGKAFLFNVPKLKCLAIFYEQESLKTTVSTLDYDSSNYIHEGTLRVIFTDKTSLICDDFLDDLDNYLDCASPTDESITVPYIDKLYTQIFKCLNNGEKDVSSYPTSFGFSYANGDSFDNIITEINNKLNVDFFSDVKVAVNLSNSSGRTETLLTKGLDAKANAEILIDIYVDEINNKAYLSIDASDEFLSEYVSVRQQDADARGIQVDVEGLRKQVLEDLESAVTHNLFSNFCQSVKSIFSESIGAFVEVVQTTQKASKTIWRDGQMDQGHWFSGAPDHDEWPGYAHMHPLIAGPADGLIDEVTGIPVAIRSIYDIMTDSEQREAFKQIFTSEGVSALIDGLSEELSATISDTEKLEHAGGKTVVSVASMFMTGGISKSGKGTSLLLEMLEKVSELKQYKKLYAFLEKVKEAERYSPDVFKKIQKQFDDVFDKFPSDVLRSKLDNMMGRLGKDGFEAFLNKLHKLKDIPGFEKVLNQLTSTGWNQFKGAKFVVDYTYDLVQKNSSLLTKIVFEKTSDILIDGKNVGRIYDILIDGVHYELKNWSNWFPSTVKTQFIRDLVNINNLDELKWVFNSSDNLPDLGVLKRNMLQTLKKADGITPIDELGDISLEKMRKLIGDKFGNISEANRKVKFLEALEDDDIFNSIFEVIN